jgi:hypothetical protein
LKVLVACEDAGGARALAPVVERLRARGDAVEVHAAAVAARTFRDAGVPVPETGIVTDASDAATRFSGEALASASVLLVSSTCWGARVEAAAVLAAQQRSVPALTVIDFWSNYRARLSFPDDDGLALVTDVVAVVDETMRRGLIEAGVSARRVTVTGSPAFDAYFDVAPPPAPARRRVLFVSQPIASLYGAGPDAPRWLGYDEASVLRALATLAGERGVPVAVRPHPREDAVALERLAGTLPGEVAMATEGSFVDAVAASSVVVGMTTVALVEAALLGRTAISAQLGAFGGDALVTNAVGLTVGVFDEGQLGAALDRALADGVRPPAERLRRLGWSPGATARVVAELDRIAVTSSA